MRHHSDLEGLLDTDRERERERRPQSVEIYGFGELSLGGVLQSSRQSSQIQGYALSLPLNFATENNLGAMEKVKDTQKQKSGIIKSLFSVCFSLQLCFVSYRCPI